MDTTERVKHTSGPWTISGYYGAPDHIAGPHGERLAVMGIRTSNYPPEQWANARLMAAAPELLEALKELLPQGWGDDTMDHIPGVKKARMAIAKAEGR